MNKETLRMQMLSGIITESEYKAKLEEAEPGNLMLSNAAKQIYQYIKSNKYNVMLQIDGKVIGANKNAPFTLYSDSKSGKISVRGIGSDQNTVKDTMTKLQNLILGHFNFLEKDGEIQVNFDGMKNASLGSFALRIKPDMLKKGQVTEALNEHYVAGGIVGIGAINQIPPRTKAVYEDAFEYFLSQKYSLNEVEEDQAVAAAEKVEDSVEDKVNIDDLSDEEKNQLRDALSKLGITADSSIEDVADKIENKIESTLSEAEENPNKKFSDALSAVGGGLLASHLVPLIPLIVGHMSGIGFFGGLAVTLGTAGALIGLAKALGDGLEEGKEVEEPSNY
jgi:hypothetical protein